jgi:hypothetical protein
LRKQSGVVCKLKSEHMNEVCGRLAFTDGDRGKEWFDAKDVEVKRAEAAAARAQDEDIEVVKYWPANYVLVRRRAARRASPTD